MFFELSIYQLLLIGLHLLILLVDLIQFGDHSVELLKIL